MSANELVALLAAVASLITAAAGLVTAWRKKPDE